MTCLNGTCHTCVDCRLERKRQYAKERQRRHRQAAHYAEVEMPLFDPTERTDFIERALRMMDLQRQRTRQASRCGV